MFQGYSGGARGADLEWTKAALDAGWKMTIFSFRGHDRAVPTHERCDVKEVSQEDLNLMLVHVKDVRTFIKRNLPAREYPRNLILRDAYTVKDAEALYAVGIIKDGMVEGGTGFSVYQHLYWTTMVGTPANVWVFDMLTAKWYQYDTENEWSLADVPPTKHTATSPCALIGSREITPAGTEAIRQFFL